MNYFMFLMFFRTYTSEINNLILKVFEKDSLDNICEIVSSLDARCGWIYNCKTIVRS